MATISKFEDLEIWQLAREQANEIHLLYCIENFSRDFALRNQVNSSSGSVMDNISEGFERSGNREFIQFFIIAKASNGEVRSQLYGAFDRHYINQEKLEELKIKNETISKRITAFIKYLKNSDRKGFRFD